MERKKIIKVMEAVLEYINCYSKEEIKEGNLAEDCEGSELWNALEEI